MQTASLRWTVALLLAALCAAPTTCNRQPGADPPPEGTPRLVVLSPAFSVILRDLGYADRIVARHAWDEVLPASVPVAGDQNALDYETIIGARPTDIVLEAVAAGPPDRLRTLAEQRRWTIHTIPSLSLDEIPGAVRTLDAIATGRSPDDDPSPACRRAIERFEHAMRRRLPQSAPDLRTLVVLSTDPVAVLGPGSAHYEVASRIGLHPIPDEGAPYITLSAEDVVALRPDAIVLLMPGADPDRLDDLLGPLRTLNIPGISDGRVALMTDRSTLWPATTLSDFADALGEDALRWAGQDKD